MDGGTEVQGIFTLGLPKTLKHGKPRLGESTLTQIVVDTPNLAYINFFVLRTFKGGTSEEEKTTLYVSMRTKMKS